MEEGMTKNKKFLPKMDNIADIARKRRIMLVDDDDVDRQLFTSALEDLWPTAEIGQLNNGVDLMSHLLNPSTKELPDLVFLDMNMPIMNGEECLSAIRSEPDLNKIPVIIYSNYYDSFKMDVLKKKGAEHYFQKPNTFEELKRLISVAIKSIERKRFKDFIIK